MQSCFLTFESCISKNRQLMFLFWQIWKNLEYNVSDSKDKVSEFRDEI